VVIGLNVGDGLSNATGTGTAGGNVAAAERSPPGIGRFTVRGIVSSVRNCRGPTCFARVLLREIRENSARTRTTIYYITRNVRVRAIMSSRDRGGK